MTTFMFKLKFKFLFLTFCALLVFTLSILMLDTLFKFLFLVFCALMVFTLSMKYPQEQTHLLQRTKNLPIFNNTLLRQIGSMINNPIGTFCFTLALFVATGWEMLWIYQTVDVNSMKALYVMALTIVFWNLILRMFVRISGRTHIPGHIKLIAPIAALALSILWLLIPMWITYDFTVILMGYAILSVIRPMAPVRLTALLLAVVIYDVWGVYGTVDNGQPGVIVQIAMQMPFIPPNLLLVPDLFHLTGMNHTAILGIGDIVLPGMAIITSAVYRKSTQAVFAYCIGLAGVFFISITTHAAVPATIMLVPATVLPVLFYSWRIKPGPT